MLSNLIKITDKKVIPIMPFIADEFTVWLKQQSTLTQNLVANCNFTAKPNTFCLLTDNNGVLEKVILGIANNNDFCSFGILPQALPQGVYCISAEEFSPMQLTHAAIGWGMGSYKFNKYKTTDEITAQLVCPDANNFVEITRSVEAIFFVRDLINLPAGDLYPETLATKARDLAQEFNAKINIVKDAELKQNFPAVYAVGKGSQRTPLLIDLCWGNEDAPKVVLIGKGVCFDSGGLQLKPSSGMLLMKKDMAGAAHALGVARMIMQAKLPLQLRVIIPAVENLISGDVLKPGDIIKTRKGLTVEVNNTDAEGRLILADALTLASEWQPQLIIDFATLTGAARVALGTELNALFANNEQLAVDIIAAMQQEQEPVWQLPLYQPYFEYIKSKMADFKNVASSQSSCLYRKKRYNHKP